MWYIATLIQTKVYRLKLLLSYLLKKKKKDFKRALNDIVFNSKFELSKSKIAKKLLQ